MVTDIGRRDTWNPHKRGICHEAAWDQLTVHLILQSSDPSQGSQPVSTVDTLTIKI